jgi:hypothetical protein
MRYTRKFIEARFAMAMDAIGAAHGDTYTQQPDGKWKANVGTHHLDHNAVYGGYRIAAIVNDGGGEGTPFGEARNAATAFVALLDGIIGAARFMKKGGEAARKAEADRRYEAMRLQDMEGGK